MNDLQEFEFSPLFEEELDLIGYPEIKLNEDKTTRKNFKRAQGKVNVSVTVDQPRWRPLASTDFNLVHQPNSSFYLVRLGFQFPDMEKNSFISQAIIQTFLEGPADMPELKPRAAEIFPTEVFEGDLRKVNLKLSPKLKFMNMELSIGEGVLQSDTGQIAPEVIGWTGEEERSPYWKLKPQTKRLIGLRHFWMVVERPEYCRQVRLSFLVDLIVSTKKFGLLPIGPKYRERSFLSTVEICKDI